VITLSAIVTGLVLAALGYQLIESWVLHRSTQGRSDAITGLDALVGTDVEVVEAFRLSGPAGPGIGRVRVGSESWQAELVDSSGRLAAVGDRLHVVGTSGTSLKVIWH
jgi:membrane protein implicated in regulation of membrane protease activity